MASPLVREHIDAGWWIKHGVIGGIIAGLIFALFEMVTAALMMGPDAFFMPLRMIGGIALGRQAMEPTFPLATAAGAGVAVHMVLSILFGMVFGVIGMIFPGLGRSAAGLLSVATVFGLALWIVNFYVIAPIAGWTWFPRDANPVQQFFAHTFFFGSVLGIYFDRAAATVRGTSQVGMELGDNLRRAA